jgi:hypothetical protein
MNPFGLEQILNLATQFNVLPTKSWIGNYFLKVSGYKFNTCRSSHSDGCEKHVRLFVVSPAKKSTELTSEKAVKLYIEKYITASEVDWRPSEMIPEDYYI